MNVKESESTTKRIEDSLGEFFNADEDVVRDALRKGGTDLRQYTNGIREELKQAHSDAVTECVKNADKLTDMHNQIVSCDQVFEKLEKMLIGFQRELGCLSEDMNRLQEQSVSIGQELENRQKVRGELSQFVDDIVVSQHMIRSILEGDPSERPFVEHLHELQHKLQFLRQQEFREAKAVGDVQATLEALKIRAMEKCREWLLGRIYQFRKPLSNPQVPQHQMLKNRFFYEFLLANERNVAKEIQEEYVDTTSKMFFTYFRTYTSRLFKLIMTDCATKDDLLGTEDTIKGGGFFSKPQVRNRATVFSLSSRQTLLTEDFQAPIIVPHVAQESGQKFQFESLFRSINFALVDHASHEYLFLSDLFLLSGSTAVDLHAKVLGRTLTQLVKEWNEKVAVNFDAISIYLCIFLCDSFHSLLKSRQVPSLSGYWETVSNLLWVRLDQIMKMHCDSVVALDVRRMQSPVDTRPHYIVRRYAELTCAFLVMTEACGKQIGKKMEALLESLEDSVEQLLRRMTMELKDQRERLVFIINNYDLILQIMDERVAHDNRVHQIIHELKQKAVNEFVEISISPHIGEIIAFVSECEPLVEQQHTNLLVRYQDRLSTVIRAFNANWKASIDAINGEIVKSFTNFKNGTNILQTAFTQLVEYYRRFSKLAAHDVFREVSGRQEMLNVHVLMVEIKKYKPVY